MRLALATIAILTLLAQSASAAGPLPHIRKWTPYAQVRSRMIAAGFRPQPVLKRPADAWLPCPDDPDPCKGTPEILECSGSGLCNYLYVRVSDGAPAFVSAFIEGGGGLMSVWWPDATARADLRRFTFAASVSSSPRPRL